MKVLFINSTNKALVKILEANNFECHYLPDISKKEIQEEIHKYEGVVTRSKITFDKELINKAKKLKFIGRVGAGMENIDVDYAEAKGIRCLNAPEGNRDAVGEQAVGMLLGLFNNICRSNSQVKNGIWKREANRGHEIGGKTIGIIGYGNTGSAFARKISGFGARVISYDKYKEGFADEYTEEVSLKEIFKKADVLSLHVPLTEDTHFMVNSKFINKFEKKIFILNTSRGKVVKTDDLKDALKKGKVLGAALDVLEYEKKSFEHLHFSKLPDSFRFLIESDNVILTPHVAGWTFESDFKLAEVLANKIVKAFGK